MRFGRFSRIPLLLKISFYGKFWINLGYRIYPTYHTPSSVHYTFLQQVHLLPVNVCKIAGRVANSVDSDQTPRSAASDLGLHCLLRPVFPNTSCKYGNLIKSNPHRIHPGSAPVRKQCRPRSDSAEGLFCLSLIQPL